MTKAERTAAFDKAHPTDRWALIRSINRLRGSKHDKDVLVDFLQAQQDVIFDPVSMGKLEARIVREVFRDKDIEDAPPHLHGDEANAWVSGYNRHAFLVREYFHMKEAVGEYVNPNPDPPVVETKREVDYNSLIR